VRFELFVDDVDASVRFYVANLGLVPPSDWDADGYVPLNAGAVTIGVQRAANLSPDHYFSPGRLSGARGVGVEIVIEVDDIDRYHEMATSWSALHGGDVAPLTDQPWGLRDFRITDPDGYYLRITSRLRGRRDGRT
jgi:catechol 2,3-dioxygenase-like lactoylglutathione lyase family enzyme